MEKGKIKNTITRSFELQDYIINGTELSGFWADLLSKEELVVEVNYKPIGKKNFSLEEVEDFVKQVCRKCDSLEAQLPENIKCEATFKNFKNRIYKTGDSDFTLKPQMEDINLTDKGLEELKTVYRFYVDYYV
jgi:hypothetical protein